MTKDIWPNFFIVGAAKSGTSSLYAWLKQHPQVFMPQVKEPHFFSSDLVRTPRFVIQDRDDYLRLFAKASGYNAIGEASASYFALANEVAGRIGRIVPHSRIIILLRDPVERAYSNYLMYVRQGIESRSFIDALVNSRFASTYAQTYSNSVRRFIEIFGKENVLVLMFETLKSSPRELLAQVAKFLDVDEDPMLNIDISVSNAGGVPRWRWARWVLATRRLLPIHKLPIPSKFKTFSKVFLLAAKPPIDKEAIDYLRPVFEKDVKELEHLLERSLPELRKVW